MSRSYCFTAWNEPTKPTDMVIRYVIFQKEQCPTTGRIHWQGYAEFRKSLRYKKFQELLKIPKARCIKRDGTRDQARDYCLKERTRLAPHVEWGDWEAGGQGTRTDVYKKLADIKAGVPQIKIMEDDFVLYAKYRNAFKEYRQECMKESTKEFRNVTTSVFVGSPGTGKTKKTMYNEDLKRKESVFSIDFDESIWWDGYEGETTLLIDDFYGCQMRYSKFIKVLDGHQLRLPIKGGFTYAKWTKIIITSNEHPKDWYKNIDTEAMMDRIGEVTVSNGPSQRKSIRNPVEGRGSATPLDFGLDG